MIVQWSVDTVDWKGVSADTITNNVLGNSFPGSIILQHSTPGGRLQGSVEALDQIIPQLKRKGTFCNAAKHVPNIERAKVNVL